MTKLKKALMLIGAGFMLAGTAVMLIDVIKQAIQPAADPVHCLGVMTREERAICEP